MTDYRGIVVEGIEDIAAEEVKGKIQEKGRITFTKLQKEYKTIDTVYEFEEECTFETEEDIIDHVKKKKWTIIQPFRVTCERVGNHLFRSADIERNIGELIYEQGYAVDLKNPKTIVFLDIRENVCTIGKLLNDNLDRRAYRVRRNNTAISASLAAALIKIAKVDPEETVLDSCCKDGVIAIEAAKQGIKRVFATDSMENNVKNAQINAKMAKVNIIWESPEDKIDNLITNRWVSAKQERSKEYMLKFLEHAKERVKKKVVVLTNWRGMENAIGDQWIIEEKRMVLRGNIKNYIFCLRRKVSG